MKINLSCWFNQHNPREVDVHRFSKHWKETDYMPAECKKCGCDLLLTKSLEFDDHFEIE